MILCSYMLLETPGRFSFTKLDSGCLQTCFVRPITLAQGPMAIEKSSLPLPQAQTQIIFEVRAPQWCTLQP